MGGKCISMDTFVKSSISVQVSVASSLVFESALQKTSVSGELSIPCSAENRESDPKALNKLFLMLLFYQGFRLLGILTN